MGRVSTRLEDDLEERVAEAAAVERLDKSTWIARACVLALEGGARDPEAAALRERVSYLEAALDDREQQLADARGVVVEVRGLRSRLDEIGQAQARAFDEVLIDIGHLRLAAAPQQALPGPAPVAEGAVRRFFRGLLS